MVGLLLLAGACSAPAGQIRLQITTSATASTNFALFDVAIANSGDSAARQVKPVIEFEGVRVADGGSAEIAAGESASATLLVTNTPAGGGVHHALLTVYYADQAGQKYSTVCAVPVHLTSPAPPMLVTGTLAPLKVRRHGKLDLTLVSTTDQTLPVCVRLTLPDELVSDAAIRTLALPPGAIAHLSFDLSNQGAAEGNTYPVFAIVDYLADGQHQSLAASGSVTILPAGIAGIQLAEWLAAGAIALALAFAVAQFRRRARRFVWSGLNGGAQTNLSAWQTTGVTALLLAALAVFMTLHFPLNLVLTDTTTVGGDTPAHNYLASHMRAELFGHGRLASWASGWWCGFPMFQYYFCLPYVLIALGSFVVPFNIAFKLVTLLGFFALPACAYGAARWLRLPRPTPWLLAVAMLPFLFVRTHSMWGVNASSTLAGMISNSLSFPLMLLAVASAWRDAEDGRYRLRSPLLLAAVLASHFFTSVMAGLALLIVPFLLGPAKARRALCILAVEGGLALLLMAWWLAPLFAKRALSMEFGSPWDVSLADTLPHYVLWLTPFLLLAPLLAVRRRVPSVGLFIWMLLSALALFQWGERLSPVFVNIRLWPFIFFALLALIACGLGLGLSRARSAGLAAAAALLAAMALVTASENDPRPQAAAPALPCARWNYEGLERKPLWPVFRDLVLPLDGTPGRLANDLSDDNNAFGSSRIFELVPHLIRKPILEGGLVNSALGAMFAYYVQSETSQSCAGAPPFVKTTTFDFTNATRHLRLFNVKHFIARWPALQAALRASPDWRFLRGTNGWELFELQTHDGRYVTIPARWPVAAVTTNAKLDALAWLYAPAALTQPVVLAPDGSDVVLPETGRPWSPDEYRQFLAAAGRAAGPRLGPWVNLPLAGAVTEESVEDDRISFRTTAIGYPHLIKVTWFPNWKVRGAARVYPVTPAFMLVYPEREKVELVYGSVWSDRLGRGLTVLGVLLALLLVVRNRGPREGGGWPGAARLLKFLDATFGAGLCWLAGGAHFVAWRWKDDMPDMSPATLRRVLVIRPGGMGDLILLIPVLRRLRAAWPRVEIDLVCEQRNAAVMALAEFKVLLLPYDRNPWRLLSHLLRTHYDAALDTEQFHHFSALLAWLSGARFRIGFKIVPARNLLYTHLVPYALDDYEGCEFGRLLDPLGVPACDYRLAGALCVPDSPLPVAAASRFERAAAQGALAAIYAGASTRYKQWGAANYGALIRRLVGERGMSVALLGGAHDREACAAAAAAAGALPEGRVVVLAGELPLAGTAQVLRRARLFVGGDSGLAHLAQALGIPAVVLFGPSDALKWGGRGDRVRIVQRPVPCAPCFIFGYHKLCRHWRCMRGIAVDDVLAACAALRSSGGEAVFLDAGDR